MFFYIFEYVCDTELKIATSKEQDIKKLEFRERSRRLNSKLKGKAQLYISSITSKAVTLFGSAENISGAAFARQADKYLSALDLEAKRDAQKEITIAQFLSLLKASAKNGYLEDDDDIKIAMGLENFDTYISEVPEETLIDKLFTKKQALARAKELMLGVTVSSEIKRIFTKAAPRRFSAHPVHYLIVSDDAKVRSAIRELLLGSLFNAGRLQNRRVCFIAPKFMRGRFAVHADMAEHIYKAQEGGTVVLTPFAGLRADDRIDRGVGDLIKQAGLIRLNRRKVLSVLELERRDASLIETLSDELCGVATICLDEETIFFEDAAGYLRHRARQDQITDYGSLIERLTEKEKGYLAADLNRLYDGWYDEHLRTEVYPQYRKIYVKQENDNLLPKGDAFQDLLNLVGLKEVKALIQSMIDHHRARKLMMEHGIKGKKPVLHMVFSGSPGTAKTTVARLTAQIMKDNNLLSVGGLVEVGRSDLVDRYVGGTAPRVRSLFQRARGSVLFIDEAYSLTDDRRGAFGDEAISTIVQEMENTREATAVIFAGYPDKMEEFLQVNPGLRSRIAFHVPFADYSKEELLAILKLFASAEGFTLEAAALQRAETLIEQTMRKEDFGNGRFVRNLFDQARLHQASRIMTLPGSQISRKLLCTITAEDFSLPGMYTIKPERPPIGF